MTVRERLYLERTGGRKACKAIHPLRLCPHPDAMRIRQRFHEDRLKQQAAKRSREGHSGVTPDGKKPLLETGRTSPTPSTSGASSSQARTDPTPPVQVTRKELINFDDMRRELYSYHANTIVKHKKDPNIHVPRWRGGLHRQKIGKDEHVVIGVATSKCLAEVEKWVKLSYPYLDCCHRAEDVPSTTFRFTGHLQGALVKKLNSDYFTTVLQHAIEERGIRGVVTLGGVKHTQGGVTIVVNMDEQARVDMVTAGSRHPLGPDGETGFVEQGGLDKADKIDHEKSLLQASMERFAEEQRAMQERYAALEKEATNREVEAVENQAAGLAVDDASFCHSLTNTCCQRQCRRRWIPYATG